MLNGLKSREFRSASLPRVEKMPVHDISMAAYDSSPGKEWQP